MLFPRTVLHLKRCAMSLNSLIASIFLALSFSGGSCLAQNAPSSPQDVHPAEPQVTVSKSMDGTSSPDRGGATLGSSSASSFGAVNGDYVLKPGDSIDMVVYREADLNIRSKIGNDGLVQIPLLGEVKIGGLSVRNATSLIRDKFNADYLVDPQIYLNVAAYNTRKFTIIGQVGRPGTYEFSGSDSLDLLEAVGMAGGFTRIADRAHVVVKRREGNAMRVLKVNAKKLSDVGLDRFEILPGDVINVAESWY